MINHIWTVICRDSIIEVDTNSISLHRVIEQINVSSEPKPQGVLPLAFEVVSFWTRANTDVPSIAKSRIKIISPSGNQINEEDIEIEINLTTSERFRSRTRFGGFLAGEPGCYWFYIDFQQDTSSDWERVAGIPVTISFTPPTAQEAD